MRALALLVAALACASAAQAQLLSPGPLARSHARLEGLRNCTQCHTLGQRGVDPDRCLTCHTPIRDRLRARQGYHGRERARECGSCHSDHHGRTFELVRWDPRRFDHRTTGYPLVGEHRSATCRSCHQPAFITDAGVRRSLGAAELRGTYLGVADDCATCHRDDNPHGASLSRRDCATCHTPTDWARTERFDHATTGTRLTGAHATADCAGCHGARGRGAARFQNTPTACASCHARDSPHGTQFRGQACSDCHATAGWDRAADAFNHATTRFALAGAHARADCASCHGSGRTARFAGTPTSCRSCHERDDPHGTQFGTRECSTCHGPTTFGTAPNFNHARTDFPLVGRHAAVACGGCHAGDGGRRQFAGVAHATCQSCHDDAHDGALGADCQTCHSPAGWSRLATTDGAAAALSDRFAHADVTGFALTGAHAAADCASCHGAGRAPAGLVRADDAFRIALAPGADAAASFPALAVADGCRSCHADAHDGAMDALDGGTDCASCHTDDAFAPATFSRARHDTETPFALTGAHAVTPCGACHTARPGDAPAFGLDATCQSCHADDSPHGDQFATADGVTACADCHATDGWSSADFDHTARTGFALTGAHAAADCASCHARPASGPWSFAGLAPACASCHADDQPHGDQFDGPDGEPADCASCHATDTFRLVAFDHDRTRFSLEGAHADVACASCHRTETAPDGRALVRFRPLPTECAGCHAAGDGSRR